MLEQLRLEAVPEAERAAAAQVILTALERTYADPRGRWILAAHREAASELRLSGLAQGQLRSIKIDRTFIDAHGVRWVIDYKTSRHEGADMEAFLANEAGALRAQLVSYVELAGALGPQPVRAGLYFPLLGAFRELPRRLRTAGSRTSRTREKSRRPEASGEPRKAMLLTTSAEAFGRGAMKPAISKPGARVS